MLVGEAFDSARHAVAVQLFKVLQVVNRDRTPMDGNVLTVVIPQAFMEALIISTKELNHCC